MKKMNSILSPVLVGISLIASSSNASAGQRIGGPDDRQSPYAVAVNAQGDSFFSGLYAGIGHLGGAPMPAMGWDSAFLTKYSKTGEFLWAKQFGAQDDVSTGNGTALAVDSKGDVFMAGDYSAGINFGGSDIPSSSQGYSIFLVKVSGDGQTLWSKTFSANHARGQCNSVSVDSNDNVVIAGSLDGSALIAKYASDGTLIFQITSGVGDPDDYSTANPVDALSLDSNGDIYITGTFYGTRSFGSAPLTAPEDWETIYVAKYSGKDGSPLWSKNFGASASDENDHHHLGRLALDGQGNPILSGRSADATTDLSKGLIAGDFILKLSAKDGMPVWVVQSGVNPKALEDNLLQGPSGVVYSLSISDSSLLQWNAFDSVSGAHVNLYALPINAREVPSNLFINSYSVALDSYGHLVFAATIFNQIYQNIYLSRLPVPQPQ